MLQIYYLFKLSMKKWSLSRPCLSVVFSSRSSFFAWTRFWKQANQWEYCYLLTECENKVTLPAHSFHINWHLKCWFLYPCKAQPTWVTGNYWRFTVPTQLVQLLNYSAWKIYILNVWFMLHCWQCVLTKFCNLTVDLEYHLVQGKCSHIENGFNESKNLQETDLDSHVRFEEKMMLCALNKLWTPLEQMFVIMYANF